MYYPSYPADSAAYAELAANPPEVRNSRYFLRKEYGTGVAELYIFPSANVTAASIAYTYVATPPVLSLDSDTFSGTADDIEYIKVYAASKLLTKEESDTTSIFAELKELESRIRNATKDVDAGGPKTVRRLRRRYRNRRMDSY